MSRWYEVKLDLDSNGTFFVAVPAFPEVTTYGENDETACRNALNAIEEAIAARISDGDDIPPPLDETTGKGWFVELPLLIFFKVALYIITRDQGISRAEIARRMGVHREQVDRIFRLDHNSRMDQIEAAFKAIGVPVSVNLPLPDVA